MTTTKSYNDAVISADALHEYDSEAEVEKYVMIGYMAALTDTSRLLNESINHATERGKAGRMYSIARDKFVRLAHGATQRASELKV